MPEFMLNRSAYVNGEGSKPHPFYALNDFAKGYVEAMFFTNGDTGDDRENLLNEWGVERLTKASVAYIVEYCADFQDFAGEMLTEAYAICAYDDAQAGRDLWFTAQGHGVGFWDRDALSSTGLKWSGGSDTDGKTLGERLTAKAEDAGECNVQVWRGWIHYRQPWKMDIGA